MNSSNGECKASRKGVPLTRTLLYLPSTHKWCTRASSSSSSSSPPPPVTSQEPTIGELLTKLETEGDEKRKSSENASVRGRTFTIADEELVADRVLTGRVKAIMTFGAFVDMGARVDGLLHISKLGGGFVKSVEDVLQVGQQVQVQIIEADLQNRRVKLRLYDPEKPKVEQQAGVPRQGSRIAARGQASRRTDYQKGQAATGVVKNLTRRGCFVELPGGEEGFLHANEISALGDSVPIETLVKVGQEVKVKVLRIADGRLNLTMKEEFDLKKLNEELNEEGTLATSAFELAFRNHPVIRKYLEESGKLSGISVKNDTVAVHIKGENAPKLEQQGEDKGDVDEEKVEGAPKLDEEVEDNEDVDEKKVAGAHEDVDGKKVAGAHEDVDGKKVAGAHEDVDGKKVSGALKLEEAEDHEETSGTLDQINVGLPEPGENGQSSLKNEPPQVGDIATPSSQEVTVSSQREVESTHISAVLVKQLREQSGAGMMDCKKALVETKGDFGQALEYLRKKGLAGADKKASRVAVEGAIGSYIHDGRVGVLLEVNCETDFVSRGELFSQLVEDLGMQLAACQQVEYISVEDVPAELRSKEFEIEMQREDIQSKPEGIKVKIVEGRVAKRFGELALLEQPFIKDDSLPVKDLIRRTIVAVGENIQVRRFTRYILGEGLEKRNYDLTAEVAAQAKAQEAKTVQSQEVEKQPAVDIAVSLVKQLREETGSGMMDCKRALVECQGNYELAKEYLRKKGLASAEKKASRIATEGLIVSYIHASRIGVLMEVNCETDFVARHSVFKELADDLAMQVVACPQVEYVSMDDIPTQLKDREREIEMQRDDLQGKPKEVQDKIVEGRLNKLFAEKALMEQAYLKDDSILVKDLVKKTTVNFGENIRVRRFVRYNLGEGLKKKSHNLVEEIAALKPV